MRLNRRETTFFKDTASELVLSEAEGCHESRTIKRALAPEVTIREPLRLFSHLPPPAVVC